MTAGFRVLLAPILLVATVAPLRAQQPPVPPPPAPPVSLTVPDPFAGMHPAGPDLYQSPDGSDRYAAGSRYPASPPIVMPPIYIPGPYGPYYSYYPYWRPGDYVSYYPNPPLPVQHGGLVLETIPDGVEVFVDGFYEGLAEDFGLRGRPMVITTGTHRIELRGSGYEASTFSVVIDPGEILRYRGNMQLVSTRPAFIVVPALGATAKPMYVIPKCYAGDKPPTVALPPGCNRKDLQTYK
jgi:hypothetical protein